MTAELSIVIKARDEASRIFGQVENSAKGLGGVLGTVGKIGLAVGGIAGGIGLAAGALKGFRTAANLEQVQITFETLLGSSEAAKQRLQELTTFAAKTPFELPGIIEADRLLQTFGARSIENLTLVGDAAAGVSAPMEEVAFWFGRAATNIQAGRPFGEAAARLQELGLLSGPARAQLEDMTKAGASSADIMGVLTGELGRFGGLMEKQSSTLGGVLSTLSDTVNLLLGSLAQPFLPLVKRGVGAAIEFIGSPRVQGALVRFSELMATGIGKAVDALGNTFRRVEPLFRGMMANFTRLNDMDVTSSGLFGIGERLAITIVEAGRAIQSFMATVGPLFMEGLRGIGDALQPLLPLFEDFFRLITTNKTAMLITIGAIGAAIAIALGPVSLAAAAIIGIIVLIGLLRRHWDDIRRFTNEVFTAIAETIDEKLGFVDELITRVIREIVEFVRTNWDEIRNIIQNRLELARVVVENFADTIKDIFRIFHGLLTGDWREAWDGLKSLVVDRLKFIHDVVVLQFELIKNAMFIAMNGAKQILSGVWDGIKLVFVAAIDFIIRRLNDLIGGINSVSTPLRALGGALGFSIPSIPTIPTIGQRFTPAPPSGPLLGPAVPPVFGPPAPLPAIAPLGGAGAGAGAAAVAGGLQITNVFEINADMSDSTIEKLVRRVTDAQGNALRLTGLQGSFAGGGVFAP